MTDVRSIVVGLGLGAAACSTSPEAPLSYAQFSASPAVAASRAQAGFVSYGAPYRKWTITLATTQGCGSADEGSIEINTLSGVLDIPVGTHPIRTAEGTIDTLPSAYVRYMGAPVLSGSVTIESATPSFITGEWTAMMTIGGAPTEVTASFGAVVCPE